MGAIPIDLNNGEGCWVQYTFPNDFVLPATPLTAYQGRGMMAAPGMAAGQEYAGLSPKTQVLLGNQASADANGTPRPGGNVIVIKGCTTSDHIGPD
jgi:hypothetical protein